MEYVVEYLQNPLRAGVHYSQFEFNYRGLEKFLRYIAERAKKKRRRSREFINDANKIKDELEDDFLYIETNDLIKYLEKGIYELIKLGERSKEIIEYLIGNEPDENIDEDDLDIKLLDRRLRTEETDHYVGLSDLRLLKPQIYDDINDVVQIEIEQKGTNETLNIEVISIKENGLKRFSDFFICIPELNKSIIKIKERKSYSSRYVFRPYPLAVQLWLMGDKANTVTEDLKNFLLGSVKYIIRKEWRPSIVLSAIAIEVILADLYEEQLKDFAPDKPLGELYYQVKEKIGFPQKIQKAIEITNEARISAVHRSRFPVSDREATNALFGATNFTLWYSLNY